MFLCAILDALIAFGEIAGVILLEVQTHTAFRGSYSIGCALATLQLLGKDFCWSWLTTIYQEGGQYSVVTAFNQDTLTKTMVLEDGLWKTLRTDEYRKEFAPDDYVYEKGRFDTLEEALEFVQHMNMEAENPFS